MESRIDFSIATSEQIEGDLCRQLANIRLARNMTQAELAKKAGITRMTIARLENGQGVSLNTFLRVLIALGLQNNLRALLPNPSIRPVERVERGGFERKRARPTRLGKEKRPLTWGNEKTDKQ